MTQEAYTELGQNFVSFEDLVSSFDSSKTYRICNRGLHNILYVDVDADATEDPTGNAGEVIKPGETLEYTKVSSTRWLKSLDGNTMINIASNETSE